MEITVQTLLDDEDHDLHVELLAGSQGLATAIGNPRVHKPGLALAGYLDAVHEHAVQVLGNTEMGYLKTLDDASQKESLYSFLCCRGIPCVVLTHNNEAPSHLMDMAESKGIPLFRTPLPTETFIVRIHNFLDEHLSPEVTLHGVMVDVFGVGVLLTGDSGVGKSECALDLILRGHRLVADDMVHIQLRGVELVGMGPELTRHHMEVRGMGIINVMDLFGAAAVRDYKKVELVVNMALWEAGAAYDRLGLDQETQDILGLAVPRINLPIRPGRNLASIVEVASRNHLLKLQGHHAARKLQETIEARLAKDTVGKVS